MDAKKVYDKIFPFKRGDRVRIVHLWRPPLNYLPSKGYQEWRKLYEGKKARVFSVTKGTLIHGRAYVARTRDPNQFDIYGVQTEEEKVLILWLRRKDLDFV